MPNEIKPKKKSKVHQAANDSAGLIYILGVIGSAVYYIQTATGFWSGVLGVLKAIVWPAFAIHKLLGL